MSSVNDPQFTSTDPAFTSPPSEGVQEQPPAPPPSIPLPAPPQPVVQPRPDFTPQQRATAVWRLNSALVAVVLVLAFLLGSFAVRNADFWRHLAVGRSLLNGQYTFGQDPFAYTTTGVYWANQAWLFDALLYLAYLALGFPALVALKALLVVGLAVVLLQIRRRGQGLWVPAACIGLALLAASPGLELQPACVSLLFLALTLWLLHRALDPGETPSPRPEVFLWLLPPLFFLWVNLDEWFLLGPLTVALYLLGELLQWAVARPRPALGRLQPLALVLAAGVFACLLSPHHYHAFTLPAEVSFAPSVRLLEQDPGFRNFFLSPLQPAYYDPALGGNVAGTAFLPLALLGVVSFVLNRRGLRVGRLLVWLALALLAAYRWQLVPFFAVAAGPLAVLNFQDWTAARPSTPTAAESRETSAPPYPWMSRARLLSILGLVVVAVKILSQQSWYALLNGPELPVPFLVLAAFVLGALIFALVPLLSSIDQLFTTWALGGRFLTLLAGLALLVTAWPGLLGPSPQDPQQRRYIRWSVEPDPSLQQAATYLGQLRQEQRLPEGHGFHVSPRLASYCAWFSPGERVFFDTRFTLFPADVVATFLQVRTLLNPGAEQRDADAYRVAAIPPLEQVRECFRDHGINHMALGDGLATRNPLPEITLVLVLQTDRRQWASIYLDGQTSILGWQDPRGSTGSDAWHDLRLDASALAFGKVPVQERVPAQAPPAPVPIPDGTWFLSPPRPPDLEVSTAAMYLFRFQVATREWQGRDKAAWIFADAAGVLGSSCPAPGAVATPALLNYRLALSNGVRRLVPVQVDPKVALAPPSRAATMLVTAQLNDFMARQDAGPPALAVLAVRASRRAIAASPQNPLGYYQLEQAYARWHLETRERTWGNLSALTVLRQVQMTTALQEALTLQPDFAEAHRELSNLFLRSPSSGVPYLDLALKHRREALQALQRKGPSSPEAEEQYQDDLDQLGKEVEDLEKTVLEKQNLYEVRSQNKQGAARADVALQHGLAEQALTILEGLSEDQQTPRAAQLQMELLLTTGQADRLRREWPTTEEGQQTLKEGLGWVALNRFHNVPAYDWYLCLLSAAIGDYQKADEQLQQIQEAERHRDLGETVARSLGALLQETSQEGPVGLLLLSRLQRAELLGSLSQHLAAHLRNEADLDVLRGVLGLERGENEQAAEDFHHALGLAYPPERNLSFMLLLGSESPLEAAALVGPSYQTSEGTLFDFPGGPAAERYLELMEAVATPRKP